MSTGRSGSARATNCSARTDDTSAQCRSSSTTTSGRRAATVPSSPASASKRRKRAWSALRSDGARGRAEGVGQLGQQAGDPRSAVAEPGAQGGCVLVTRERARDLHPRPVRRSAASVPARPPRPRGAARGSDVDERASEGGLADARLAGHRDEAPAPGEGVAQRAVEPFELRAPSDERVRVLPHTTYVGAPVTSPQNRDRP